MIIPAKVLPVQRVIDTSHGRFAYLPVSEPIECAEPVIENEEKAA